MKKVKKSYLLLIAIIGIFAIIAGCSSGGGGESTDAAVPSVVSTNPADLAIDVAIGGPIIATFSEDMDPATITGTNYNIMDGVTPVAGTVTYDPATKSAVFTTNVASPLDYSTLYTATVSSSVTDLAGNPMDASATWSFTTVAAPNMGPDPVVLGNSALYVILAKTAVSSASASVITGNLGLSPAPTSYFFGFSITNATGYATSSQVSGFMYAADMAEPTPTNLTSAVSDMELAYTDAQTRPTPDFVDAGSGNLGGLTLAPGLYNFTTGVTIPTNVTLDGSSNDVWIFQIPGTLTVASDVDVLLTGGAQAKNIFWQVSGITTLGTGSHFEGIVLGKTQIIMDTGASLTGRALAQTQVTLDASTIVGP